MSMGGTNMFATKEGGGWDGTGFLMGPIHPRDKHLVRVSRHLAPFFFFAPPFGFILLVCRSVAAWRWLRRLQRTLTTPTQSL